MWRMGDPDDEGEEETELEQGADEMTASEAAAPTRPPVVPSSTEAAMGHSKVVVVIISTLFMDAWARGGEGLGGPEPPPLLAR